MIACLDLEGVLLPEIWIKFAEKTGVEALKLTTRDIPDYNELMTKRLSILKENNFKLEDIKDVISTLKPLDGAIDFHKWLRSEFEVIILSDTFYQFVNPLMMQLDYPTLFCHQLVIDSDDSIVGYKLRQPNGKPTQRPLRLELDRVRRSVARPKGFAHSRLCARPRTRSEPARMPSPARSRPPKGSTRLC